MLDKLNDMLPYLERLPTESQEEVMGYLEVLIEAIERDAVARGRMRQVFPALPQTEAWQDPVGAWSDLPDSLLEELDQLRHTNPPTPPIEDL